MRTAAWLLAALLLSSARAGAAPHDYLYFFAVRADDAEAGLEIR